MMVLVGKGYGTLRRYSGPNVGRLIQPRDCGRPYDTARDMMWAADNDAFNGFKPGPFRDMLRKWQGLPRCLFVACPDVVADWKATHRLFDVWEPEIRHHMLPVAYVTQDGVPREYVPWHRIDAIFVGGTDAHKLGDEAARLTVEAKARRKWVHMGRVNSGKRVMWARDLGVDSIDGTSVSMFTDTHLPTRIEQVRGPFQPRLSA